MKTLIKSAQVVQPDHPLHGKTVAILIEDGHIAKIGNSITSTADCTINIPGLHLSLGWFDSGVSFGEPGYEERETLKNGLQTAAKSGFTAIGLHPDTQPVIDRRSSIEFLKRQAEKTATALYPIGALTQDSAGKELAELYDMATAGAIAFGDYKKSVNNPDLLKIALQYAQGFDGLIVNFSREEHLSVNGVVNEGIVSTQLGLRGIPALAEELQLARDLQILAYTGGKLHIPTLSTVGSLKLIREGKDRGLDITCSVALPNLFFTDEKLENFDARFKVNPPLRTEKDRLALIEGVKDGSIDMVTADHRPIDIEHKKLEFEQAEYGSIGLESAFGALNHLLGTEKAIALLTRGRQRFGIEEPLLKEGAPAELSLFMPEEDRVFSRQDIHSTSKNSMFINVPLKGKPLGVVARNRVIWNEQ